MKGSKRILLVALTCIFSYATGVVIFPFSYWRAYFDMSSPRIVIDFLLNLLFYMAIVESSLFIDRKLNKRVSWMVSPLKRLLIQMLYQILGVFIIMICLMSFYLIFADFIGKPSPYIGLREAFFSFLLIIFWALMISALNIGDYLLKNWKIEALKAVDFEVKAAQSKQLAAEIELEALKLQFDPHFVFDNLTVLSELIMKDQQLGYEYTENFARVYRHLLVNSKKKLIPLNEELKFLDAYIFLISNSAEAKRSFQIDIDESRLTMLISPLTLQLSIENAIKHCTEGGGDLVVSIYSNDDNVVIVSTDGGFTVEVPLTKQFS